MLEVVDCPVVKILSIGNGSAKQFKSFVVKSLPCLASVFVGNECFENVDEVELVGLSELESVEIGKNSFTKHKNGAGNYSNGHFYLKDCPKLKSLKMGKHSFSDYTACVIENVDALEVVEMGGLNAYSYNFYSASLELKSILVHNE